MYVHTNVRMPPTCQSHMYIGMYDIYNSAVKCLIVKVVFLFILSLFKNLILQSGLQYISGRT